MKTNIEPFSRFFPVTGVTKMYLRSRTLDQQEIRLDDMGDNFEVGDWKLLYLLGRNMEPLVFGEFLRELHNALKAKESQTGNHEDAGGSKQPLITA